MEQSDGKNLILAIALSMGVMLVWYTLFPPEELEQAPAETPVAEQQADGSVPAVSQGTTAAEATAPSEEVAQAARIAIETPTLSGSISLQGGRIDDLSLTNYRETIEEGAPTVTLLKPVGQPEAYYTVFGWAGIDGIEAVPGPDTIWTLEDGETLTPKDPVTLRWDNGAGQIFRTRIAVDQNFMFTFEQSIENSGGETVSVRPYGLIRRHGEPSDMKNFFILQEGPLQMSDGVLQAYDYDDIVDLPVNEFERVPAERVETTSQSWLGFTDHYWQTILIPDQDTPFRSTLKYVPSRNVYQAEAILPVEDVAAGATATVSTRVFAGAKEWEAITAYEEAGVTRFDDSIDWGWFFFLTKPIFWLLHTLNGVIGNMGWAIIALTFILKALVLPLAYKSYVSMARMKELQPEMEALKERAGDDRQMMQQGMMKLYKDNKVNPASGCLPILLQIPIFFSLYKVIFVTIELRHAEWVGWIRDLSAPDPSSIFNFYGLLPWAAPEPGSILALIFIGIMPLVLGVSMWLQQKLNPAPTDPTQKAIFAWMPWVFMFMLGSFASGLVLYWITNNVITFIQQYAIMRSHGSKPDLFGNITGRNKTPTPVSKKPANADKKPKGK